MTFNLDQMTVEELETLADQVQKAIVAKKTKKKKNLLNDIEQIAREAGVSLNELFAITGSPTKSAKPKAAVAVKYKNPSNSSQTWTGRGRQPLWVVAILAEGKRLDDLLI